MSAIEVSDVYMHKKSGVLYRVVDLGLDCTNSRDGTRVVIYRNYLDVQKPTFVRELDEFCKKFERVPTP
jgi:hypothetical protein